MITFIERVDSFFNAQRNYSSDLKTKGYYTDNIKIRWEPSFPEDMEPEKPFGPGSMAVVEFVNYDWRDCEAFYSRWVGADVSNPELLVVS